MSSQNTVVVGADKKSKEAQINTGTTNALATAGLTDRERAFILWARQEERAKLNLFYQKDVNVASAAQFTAKVLKRLGR